jgi:glycosyltransferase involved in cell wall biosynthesis
MRVVYLAAGAAGMYCGSCLHDNRLAAALRTQGRDVVLVPLYTPLRTDERDVSTPRVYFGGINVYLQQVTALFQHTPAFLDRLLDAPFLLRSVGRFAAQTRPEVLGAFTLSVLQGEQGRQRKELRKLVAGLHALQPSLVHLPNLMFAGLAPALKAALSVPVLCGLTGEDVFLDRLPEPYRTAAFDLIRARAGDIDGFVALTDYYARHATAHFGLPAGRVQRIPMGIRATDFSTASTTAPRPFTIGYLARVCPEKGLAELARAFLLLRQRGRACPLRAAGYLGPADKPYLARILDDLRAAGALADFEYVGEVSRDQKLAFLHTLDVLSVPAAYAESKGFYVLEALAAGVPVVQPAHGSFPELLAATGGGVLYEPGNVAALADALAALMDDAPRRQQLAAQGRAAVHRDFTADRMAVEAWRLYERFV